MRTMAHDRRQGQSSTRTHVDVAGAGGRSQQYGAVTDLDVQGRVGGRADVRSCPGRPADLLRHARLEAASRRDMPRTGGRSASSRWACCPADPTETVESSSWSGEFFPRSCDGSHLGSP